MVLPGRFISLRRASLKRFSETGSKTSSLQSWPTSSPTSEFLLSRGESVEGGEAVKGKGRSKFTYFLSLLLNLPNFLLFFPSISFSHSLLLLIVFVWPNIRIVSTAHGVGVGLFAAYIVMWKRCFSKECFFTYPKGLDTCFSAMLGYNIYDLVTMYLGGDRDVGMWIHHILLFFGTSLEMVGYLLSVSVVTSH